MGWIASLFGRSIPSTPPGVMDRVRIARTPDGHASLRNQVGKIEMIADGRLASVRLDNGKSVMLDISSLDRV